VRDISGLFITRGTLRLEKIENIKKKPEDENLEKFPSQRLEPRESWV
jgi:hypothetical protein